MTQVRPFCAIRPRPDKADAVACLPYDVMSRREAAAMAGDNPDSYLRIIRADAFMPEDIDEHDPRVYEQSAATLRDFLDRGTLIVDPTPRLYVYRQYMDGHVQTGIVGCVNIDDYSNGSIKRHELTLKAKEQDRINHFDACDTGTEPIFLTYRADDGLDDIIHAWAKDHTPVYDVTVDDEVAVRHLLWVIDDDSVVAAIVDGFTRVDALYIADGHHRSASHAAVCKKRRDQVIAQGGTPDPNAEYNFMMAAIFPDHDLLVMDYNRIIADLNDLDVQEFLAQVKDAGFSVDLAELPEGTTSYIPDAPHVFGMYVAGDWYRIEADPSLYEDADIRGRLDVSILQDNLLAPLLGVGDPRTDSRIRCVGGIRGVDYLAHEVDDQGTGVAFSMYPVSIAQIMSIADAGQIMPPKSTWFEPKLGSGLFAHALH